MGRRLEFRARKALKPFILESDEKSYNASSDKASETENISATQKTIAEKDIEDATPKDDIPEEEKEALLDIESESSTDKGSLDTTKLYNMKEKEAENQDGIISRLEKEEYRNTETEDNDENTTKMKNELLNSGEKYMKGKKTGASPCMKYKKIRTLKQRIKQLIWK